MGRRGRVEAGGRWARGGARRRARRDQIGAIGGGNLLITLLGLLGVLMIIVVVVYLAWGAHLPFPAP